MARVAVIACSSLVAAAALVASVVVVAREAWLALAGLIAVTAGLALRELASPLWAGIALLRDRPFQLGDRVTVAGHRGEVSAIGLRSVRLVTPDGATVTIPSSRLLTEIVVSRGNAADAPVIMRFHVAPDSDVDVASRVVHEAVCTSQYARLHEPVAVLVADVVAAGCLATRLEVRAHVVDARYQRALESDVTRRVKRAFRERGIRPPGLAHPPAAPARPDTA